MSKLLPNEAADLTEKGEKHFLAEEKKPREGARAHGVELTALGLSAPTKSG